MQYICNQTCQPDCFACMCILHHVSLQHAPERVNCLLSLYVEVEFFVFFFQFQYLV